MLILKVVEINGFVMADVVQFFKLILFSFPCFPIHKFIKFSSQTYVSFCFCFIYSSSLHAWFMVVSSNNFSSAVDILKPKRSFERFIYILMIATDPRCTDCHPSTSYFFQLQLLTFWFFLHFFVPFLIWGRQNFFYVKRKHARYQCLFELTHMGVLLNV